MIQLHEHETLDDLLNGGLKIIQAREGYRFSIDPVLLVDFARFPDTARVADLGSGNGIVPMLLAARDETLSVVGLELQSEMVDRASRSIVLNNLQKNVEVVQVDVRKVAEHFRAGCFDVVVTNPPYRSPLSGRTAKGAERSLARHEIAGGLPDFLSAAEYMLKSGGLFFVVYLADRLTALLSGMSSAGLEPKRMRMVHSRSGGEAKLVLVEGRKNGRPGLKVEPPLFIYDGPGRSYTDEVQRIYGLGN